MLDTSIKRVADLMQILENLSPSLGGDELWWRGIRQSQMELQPGAYRDSRDCIWETSTVTRFLSRAPSRHPNCPSMSHMPEWLFLMQHYGLPTRLLDWTESPLIAMFFAVRSFWEHPTSDSAIWALNPYTLNKSQIGDASVIHPKSPEASPLFAPAFDRDLPAQDKVIAIVTTEVDVRMLVQQSVFTIHGSAKPLNQYPDSESYLRKFIIPCSSKGPILIELMRLGFTSSNLFPDLQQLAADLSHDTYTQARAALSSQSKA